MNILRKTSLGIVNNDKLIICKWKKQETRSGAGCVDQ